MTFEDVKRLFYARDTGPDSAVACCPCHDDENASLSIKRGQKQETIIFCHACGKEKTLDICRAKGITTRDLCGNAEALQPAKTSTRQPGKLHDSLDSAIGAAKWSLEQRHGKDFQLVGKWLYHNSDGTLCAWVCRFENPAEGRDSKKFQPIRKHGMGWRVGDPPGKWPLYHLPEISKTDKGATIFVVEGEKACDAARSIGLETTTSAHGANAANKTDWTPLAGRDVVILPDNDKSGVSYAEEVATILKGLNA